MFLRVLKLPFLQQTITVMDQNPISSQNQRSPTHSVLEVRLASIEILYFKYMNFDESYVLDDEMT